jgi:hypothetical protein
MNRLVLGAVGALALVGVGLFWWQGQAEVERGAPPPSAETPPRSDALPLADARGLKGPTPPEASELDQEQQRFARYDRNRDWKISRNEMLSTRSDAFRKLDKDGNNLLTFEEWAVTTVDRFDGADANKDGWLSQREFATTKPPAVKKPKCKC